MCGPLKIESETWHEWEFDWLFVRHETESESCWQDEKIIELKLCCRPSFQCRWPTLNKLNVEIALYGIFTIEFRQQKVILFSYFLAQFQSLRLREMHVTTVVSALFPN